MNNLSKSLQWVDRYTPSSIDDCILPMRIKSMFINMRENDDYTNLILSGGYGAGKTSLVLALMEETNADYIMYNGSNGSLNREAIREDLEHFGSTSSLPKNGKPRLTETKFVIIDECDGLSDDIFKALRHATEAYKNVRYILTCNFPERIAGGMISRMPTISFNYTTEEKHAMIGTFGQRCIHILEDNKIEYSIDALRVVLGKFYPDHRRCINTLQAYSKQNGKIDMSVVESINYDVSTLFTAIKSMDVRGVRQWLMTNASTSTYSLIWRESENYIPDGLMPNWVLHYASCIKYINSAPNIDMLLSHHIVKFMDSVPNGYDWG